MSQLDSTPTCAQCGGPLGTRDLDRGTCHDCRSPSGTIAELDIAIRSSAYETDQAVELEDRFPAWSAVLDALQDENDTSLSDVKRWSKCKRLLQFKCKLQPNDYLAKPLTYLQWLAEHKFPKPDELPATQKRQALLAFQTELAEWQGRSSPDKPGYFVEFVKATDPLHEAAVALQPFYGGAFPRPAIVHWRSFLRFARSEDVADMGLERLRENARSDGAAARVEAERLLDWARVEIESLDAAQQSAADGSPSLVSKSAPNGKAAVDESASHPLPNGPKISGGGWMGDVELAGALGVHSSQIAAFRAKLKRMRDKGELSLDDWREIENRKRNEPQFLYRADSPAIVAMAKRYSLPK